MKKICKNCGQEFDGRANKEFCCKKCNNEYAYRQSKNETSVFSADKYVETTDEDFELAETTDYNRLKSANYLSEKSSELPSRANNYSQNSYSMHQALTDAKERIQDLEDDLQDKEEEIAELNDEIQELQNNNSLLMMNRVMFGDVNSYRNESAKMNKTIDTLRTSNLSLAAELESANEKIKTLKEHLKNILTILNSKKMAQSFESKINHLYFGWGNASKEEVLQEFANYISEIESAAKRVFNFREESFGR